MAVMRVKISFNYLCFSEMSAGLIIYAFLTNYFFASSSQQVKEKQTKPDNNFLQSKPPDISIQSTLPPFAREIDSLMLCACE